MGIKTVALFAEDDKELVHAEYADEGIALGEGALSETYLNIEKIIKEAKKLKVDAIHPGYGFLSENTLFAQACEENNIIFVGPRAENIKVMGDKIASKQVVEKLKLPLVPGYHGDNQDEGLLLSEAKKIGFPVLVKASAGGGGKGMRIIESEADFSEGLKQAKSEALKAFSNDKVLIEKYITGPRHIEIQVLSDNHGNHRHLFERECSVQRRYQKVIEETPACHLSQETKDKMGEVAVSLCRGINYLGAGTVEFIVDENENFYFLEMNTRLQVEHPITEEVTGVDLVEWQVRIAQGEELTLPNLVQRGHAIECRICAENPDEGFVPATGVIKRMGDFSLSGARVDTGFKEGNEVGLNYDSMIAKVIVHGATREVALAKMKVALEELSFTGVVTNRNYLYRILNNETFIGGKYTTNFIKEEDLSHPDMSDDEVAQIAAVQLLMGQSVASEIKSQNKSVWQNMGNKRF